MGKARAVIDTNVLYAGLYSANGASFRVLQAVERGRLKPVLSTSLLFEYEEVLRRDQERLRLSDRAVQDVLDGLCLRGEAQAIHFLWRPWLPDGSDDHVLELAVAAGGVDIVTHNLRHFGPAAAFGVRVLAPAELLGELR